MGKKGDAIKASGAKLDFEDIDLKDGAIDRISVRAIFPKKSGVARKNKDSAVKINSELLVDVEEFINLDENKFRYVNRKQFVDIAVADYLRRMRRGSQRSTSGEAKK